MTVLSTTPSRQPEQNQEVARRTPVRGEAETLMEEFSNILDKIAVQVRVGSGHGELLEAAPVALKPKRETRPVSPVEREEAEGKRTSEARGENSEQDDRSTVEAKERETSQASDYQDTQSVAGKTEQPAAAVSQAAAQVATKPAAVQGVVDSPAPAVTEGADPEVTFAGSEQQSAGTTEGQTAANLSGPGKPADGGQKGVPASETVKTQSATVSDEAISTGDSVTPAASLQGTGGSDERIEVATLLRSIREQLGLSNTTSANGVTGVQGGIGAGVMQRLGALELNSAADPSSTSKVTAATGRSALGLLDGAGRMNSPFQQVDGSQRRAETADRGDLTRSAKTLPRGLQQRTMERVENVLKEVAQSKDGKSISLRLDPPSLGSLKIDVTYRDNSLHARIVGESAAVVAVLRERAYELQESLRKLGLDVDRITIAVGTQGEEGSSQQMKFEGDRGSGGGTQQGEAGFGGSQAPLDPSVLEVVTQIDDHWVA
jgi:flagellar hook-length control protein FliK